MADIKEKDKDITKVEMPAAVPAAKPRARKKASVKTEKTAENTAENALPEDPAEFAKYKEEKLNALVEKGKKASSV